MQMIYDSVGADIDAAVREIAACGFDEPEWRDIYIGENSQRGRRVVARSVYLSLKKAKEIGIKNIDLYADSKLVVEQLSGRWKVKEPTLKELVKNILEIKFESITFNWIPRKENVHADQLANKAMDLNKK